MAGLLMRRAINWNKKVKESLAALKETLILVNHHSVILQ